jgi:hypothetical protein
MTGRRPSRRLVLALSAGMLFTSTADFLALLLMDNSPLSALWQSLFVTITTTVFMVFWYRRYGHR